MSKNIYVADYDCDATYEDEYGNEIHDEFVYDDYICNIKHSKAIRGGKDGFFIYGRNLNWRGSDGFAYAKTLEDVGDKILMHDGRCRTSVWKPSGNSNTLEAISYHHDVPTGSEFTIMTLSKARKEFPEEVKQLGL
ncbi:MAG: hypothetical protein ACXABD_13270 [Candidatus Thorarchaeota archaeon]|jgi:hypothetical protein